MDASLLGSQGLTINEIAKSNEQAKMFSDTANKLRAADWAAREAQMKAAQDAKAAQATYATTYKASQTPDIVLVREQTIQAQKATVRAGAPVQISQEEANAKAAQATYAATYKASQTPDIALVREQSIQAQKATARAGAPVTAWVNTQRDYEVFPNRSLSQSLSTQNEPTTNSPLIPLAAAVLLALALS